MKSDHAKQKGESRRRGVTIISVAVGLTVIIGFCSLTVDLGMMYNARADLQRAADAGAMGAAEVLSNYYDIGDATNAARNVAQQIVQSNKVLGETVSLDTNVDVVFGRSNYDGDANQYNFTPSMTFPDAVRVTVRKTDSSPNGPLPLFFAGIFGRSKTNVWATATATVSPRDIALVADLSGSQLYDSQLKRYDERAVNLHGVWDAFPGGADENPSTWAAAEIPADQWQAKGPGWGFMKELGYGNDLADTNYAPSLDPGLKYLPANQVWSDSQLNSYLQGLGYSNAEISALNNTTGNYTERVAVALGLAYWNSGIAGGLWSTIGIASSNAGNGNNTINSSELIWSEQVLDNSVSNSADIWKSYINYATANDEFRYRFGIKTFMGYILDKRGTPQQTPELADVPVQPLQATKDATAFLMGLFTGANAADLVSLETYTNTARHELDLTNDFASISAHLNTLSPNEYGNATNIGSGIQKGIDELTSTRVRTASRKVMVLLTDGIANIDASGNHTESGAKAWALNRAQAAADEGIRIYAVSVGQGADQNLMQQIADITGGVHFHAEGTIEEYSAQMTNIFWTISGQREVELIE